MNRNVKIERAHGDGWEHLYTVDIENENTWPDSLPADIRKVLFDGIDDSILVTNNHVSSGDGGYYRLTEL